MCIHILYPTTLNKEVKYDNFETPTTGGGSHFTPVVWTSSTYIGVGLASGKRGHWVVVNYLPGGNTIGWCPRYMKRGSYKPERG